MARHTKLSRRRVRHALHNHAIVITMQRGCAIHSRLQRTHKQTRVCVCAQVSAAAAPVEGLTTQDPNSVFSVLVSATTLPCASTTLQVSSRSHGGVTQGAALGCRAQQHAGGERCHYMALCAHHTASHEHGAPRGRMIWRTIGGAKGSASCRHVQGMQCSTDGCRCFRWTGRRGGPALCTRPHLR